MDETIRLLHLSDLHAREGTAWDANRVRQTLIEDLNDPARADLRPDLVLFTGDLAWAGKPEQFERGWTFLDAVLKACDLDREALFLVPGNHDVDRSKINMFVRDWLAQADHAKVEDLIQAGGDNWLLLTQRLDAYRAFLDKHELAHLQTDPDRAIWTADRTIRNCSIGLAGFNTAWSCSADDKKGQLWAGAHWQHETLHAAVRDADVRIALLHWPYPDFVDT